MKARDEDLGNYLEWKYDNDAAFKARTDKMAANWERLGNTLDSADDFTYTDFEGLDMAYKKKKVVYKKKKAAHKRALWSVYQDDEYTKRFGASVDDAGRETEQWVEHDAESKEAWEWLAKNH